MGSNLDIVLVPKGTQSFDAYIKNPQAPPLTLGFNFPILNKDTFINSENPECNVNKSTIK